jgi:hypothetical protein
MSATRRANVHTTRKMIFFSPISRPSSYLTHQDRRIIIGLIRTASTLTVTIYYFSRLMSFGIIFITIHESYITYSYLIIISIISSPLLDCQSTNESTINIFFAIPFYFIFILNFLPYFLAYFYQEFFNYSIYFRILNYILHS